MTRGSIWMEPRVWRAAWVPELALSEFGPRALDVVADLVAGAGAAKGLVAGTGHPDDPYRVPLGAGIPEPAVWFPPAGLEPRVTAVPQPTQARLQRNSGSSISTSG